MRYAVFVLLMVACPLSAADEDTQYYPLKVGSKSTYRIGGLDQKLTVNVVKEEKVGDQPCFVLEFRLDGKVDTTQHVAVLKDGVYRFKNADSIIEPPICFFKGAGKKGDSWKQEFKVANAVATVKFELNIEDVEVPAGKYAQSRVIKMELIEKETTTKATMWFAKGVGMVKETIETGGTTMILELEKTE